MKNKSSSISNLSPEIDYNFLMGQLKDYADPWGKIGEFLKTGELIRVKKGIYVLGAPKTPYSLSVLANMMYGPSYLSKEFALAFYGLIPEKVHLITSVTPKRNKQFDTPVGRFAYEYQNVSRYSIGFTRQEIDQGRGFLIATPEKALVDTLWHHHPFASKNELREYLTDDLRIDLAEIRKLRTGVLKDIAERFRTTPSIAMLHDVVKELK